jgi:hypothetical protein
VDYGVTEIDRSTKMWLSLICLNQLFFQDILILYLYMVSSNFFGYKLKMSKRLALLLFGRAYSTNPQNKRIGNKTIDYQKSLNNYREYIFNHFENIGYIVDVFFATNDDIPDFKKRELISDYQPVAPAFVKDDLNDYTYSRITKVRTVLELCRSNHNRYDHVILTRFDLIFKDKFDQSNIDYKRLNFVSILEQPDFLCDNFYLFPYSLLDKFIKVVGKVYNPHRTKYQRHSMHFCMKQFKEHFEEFNFIKNEKCCVHKLSFYSIKRNVE